MKGGKRPIDQVDEPEEQSTMTQSERYRATLRDILPELADDHPLFSQVAVDRFRRLFAPSPTGSASNAPNRSNTVPPAAPGLMVASSTPAMRCVASGVMSGRDRLRALPLNIDKQQAFTAMRQQGMLALTQGPRAEPSVVWYSDSSYLNPRRQPAGPGHFDFQADDDEELAALNFGGPTGYGLPDRPSAAEIWQLRGGFLRERRNDLTENINVVWIPDAQDAGPTPNVTSTPTVAPAAKPKRKYQTRDSSSNNHDKEPQPETYDPTNGQKGGINDQTSTRDHPRYYAINVEGNWICQNRSTAQVGLREPHLMRAYGKTGWRTWNLTKPPKLEDFDWDNKEHIKLLERWRYQMGYRNDFDNLREEHRDLYTLEECQWLAEEYQAIKKDGRIHPPDDFLDMTKRFNANFGGDRVHGAMRTKYDRVRQDFEKTGVVNGPTLYEKRPEAKPASNIRLVVKKLVASEAAKPAVPGMLDIVKAALTSKTPSMPADITTAEQKPSADDSPELEDGTEVTGEVTEVIGEVKEGPMERAEGADEDTAIVIGSDSSDGSAERLGEAAQILHRMSGRSRDGEK
ncbi:hypothetical protein LTR95_002639 [Oleoguttula sp. CCFEE 5521]